MIGEVLVIKPHHLAPARELAALVMAEYGEGPKRYAISIAGETGSGKATLAMALKHVLKEHNVKSFIFHMEDYYHRPPTYTHIQRLEDINHVGPQEVNLELLEKHICQVKKGLSELIKPMSHYKENEIRKEIVNFDSHKVIIVEGNYTSTLKYIDKKVFINKDFHEVEESRKVKKLSPYSPFVEQVLLIDHEIIKKHKEYCHLIINSDYEIEQNSSIKDLT